MTRINLIDPKLLSDQHLMAEYRELPMVPAALNRSLKSKTIEQVLSNIPSEFTLNKGHVTFFYDKLQYLSFRYLDIKEELINRGFKLDEDRDSKLTGFDSRFYNDYEPRIKDVNIIKERLLLRLKAKDGWYKYLGAPLGYRHFERAYNE